MRTKNILPIRSYTEMQLEGLSFPDEEKIERTVSSLSKKERRRLLKSFEHNNEYDEEVRDIEVYNNIRKTIKR